MKIQLPEKVTREFYGAGLQLKKHSPEILLATGIVTGITATVMACKATLKLDEVLEKHEEQIDAIHKAMENPELLPEPYTEKEAKRAITITYVKTGLDLAKLYGFPIAMGAVSITSTLAGYGVLNQRYVSASTAFASTSQAFKEYRGRVVERFGAELDKELRYDLKTKEVGRIVKHEDGTEEIVKSHEEVCDMLYYSEYARFFDASCKGWSKDADFNLKFLKDQQRYANDRLRRQGFLFLNDVYESLGIPKCKLGQIVGWIYDEKNPIGDNYVDFGIFDSNKPQNMDFINGYEKTIILDFNVDGNILDLI